MNKILLALFVCVISVNAFACGGGHDDGEENKKSETVTTVQR